MQFFTTDDRATRIGDVIGAILAVAIYVGLFTALGINFFQH